MPRGTARPALYPHGRRTYSTMEKLGYAQAIAFAPGGAHLGPEERCFWKLRRYSRNHGKYAGGRSFLQIEGRNRARKNGADGATQVVMEPGGLPRRIHQDAVRIPNATVKMRARRAPIVARSRVVSQIPLAATTTRTAATTLARRPVRVTREMGHADSREQAQSRGPTLAVRASVSPPTSPAVASSLLCTHIRR